MASRKGRHRRRSRAAKIMTAAGSAAVPGIAIGVLLAGGAHAGGGSPQDTAQQDTAAVWHIPFRMVSDEAYTVQPGDDLSVIAARLCGDQADWTGLATANRIPYPYVIYAGSQLRVDCADPALSYRPVSSGSHSSDPPPDPPVTRLSGTLGCTQLEDLWEAAGGSPSEAFTAAEIAMAESGGNQWATGSAGEESYWQVNPVNDGMVTDGYVIEASYDPMTNARDTVALSDDGNSWSDWTTYTSGAYIGRC
jgi:hypothetical protein